MNKKINLAILALSIVLLSCASSQNFTKTTVDQVQTITQNLNSTKDADFKADLLLQRGHIYLTIAEMRLAEVRAKGRLNNEFAYYGNPFVLAINDFNEIEKKYSDTAAAPEALLHTAIAYDMNNLAVPSLSIKYYKRTINEYPGSKAAFKAAQIVGNYQQIEKYLKM